MVISYAKRLGWLRCCQALALVCLLNLAFYSSAACVTLTTAEREQAPYCGSLLDYPIDESLKDNLEALDDEAAQLYLADKNAYLTFPRIKCVSQTPGASMCANCLATRRQYHCATKFPFCRDDNPTRPFCRSLCKRIRDHCKDPNPTTLNCKTHPTSDCASAATGVTPMRMLTTIGGSALLASLIAFAANFIVM